MTVRASPPGTSPRTSYSSRSEHPIRFPGDFAGPSHGAPSTSFGAPSVDRMSIAASGDEFTSSEDEGADSELTAMLARAAVSIGLEVLTALTSIKRVGDIQAFSVSEECLVFGPAYSHVVLRTRPGYVPKVPTTPFRDQVVNLQALPLEEADPALALLCPIRALRIYVDRTRSFRSSEQLFVCHGGQQKGKAVSKQRLAHWIVEAVALAYQSQGEPCPLGVRTHSILQSLR